MEQFEKRIKVDDAKYWVDVFRPFRETNKRERTAIRSCDYGGQEVPQHTICKLENHESPWYSAWVQRSKSQERWCPKTEWMPSLGRKQTCPSSTWFSSGSQWIGWCLPALVKVVFTQSTDSNVNLFQKHPEIMLYQYPLAQSSQQNSPPQWKTLKQADKRNLVAKKKKKITVNRPFLWFWWVRHFMCLPKGGCHQQT